MQIDLSVNLGNILTILSVLFTAAGGYARFKVMETKVDALWAKFVNNTKAQHAVDA